MSERGPPHPNVVQYLIKEEKGESVYIALELCRGNLRILMRDVRLTENAGALSHLVSRECIRQIVEGLRHLHDCGIEQRDIKPSNILWNVSRSGKLRLIVSDFDLGHFTGDQSVHKPQYGSTGWSAPELWDITNGKRTTAVDIFSLGCVLYYILTRGGHPFSSLGNSKVEQASKFEELQGNIVNVSLSGLIEHTDSQFEAELAKDLIGSMIHSEVDQRPTAHEVLDHPFFWDMRQTEEFYHEVSNFLQKQEYARHLVERLEQNSSNVIQGDWMAKLDKAVKGDVIGFRAQKTQVCGLLRVIRNKTEHYAKFGPELKRTYGRAGGVVPYYNHHFPRLIHTYSAWLQHHTEDQLPSELK